MSGLNNSGERLGEELSVDIFVFVQINAQSYLPHLHVLLVHFNLVVFWPELVQRLGALPGLIKVHDRVKALEDNMPWYVLEVLLYLQEFLFYEIVSFDMRLFETLLELLEKLLRVRRDLLGRFRLDFLAHFLGSRLGHGFQTLEICSVFFFRPSSWTLRHGRRRRPAIFTDLRVLLLQSI